jgi:hypothetical protein
VTRPSLLTPLITSFLAAPPHDARRAEQVQTGRHPQDQGPRQVTDGTAAARAAQATAEADALAEALQAARAAQQAAETAAAQAAAALRDARERAAAAQAAAREQAAATEGASALCAGDGLTGRDPVTGRVGGGNLAPRRSQVADLLGTHPQHAYETCAHLAGHGTTPAQQRPHHAVVLTAGLAAEHDMRGQYGIDLEDLSPGHSLHTDPGVRRVRDAAELVGEDVWICVTIPGDFEGAEGDLTAGVDVIDQWTSVAVQVGELTWLRETLTLNAAEADVDD